MHCKKRRVNEQDVKNKVPEKNRILFVSYINKHHKIPPVDIIIKEMLDKSLKDFLCIPLYICGSRKKVPKKIEKY